MYRSMIYMWTSKSSNQDMELLSNQHFYYKNMHALILVIGFTLWVVGESVNDIRSDQRLQTIL